MPGKNQQKSSGNSGPNIQDIIDKSTVISTRSATRCKSSTKDSSKPAKQSKPTSKDETSPSSMEGSPAPSFISPTDITLEHASVASHSSSCKLPLAQSPVQSKSQYVFEFNSPITQVEPLIPPCNRGDSGAMSDALNQVYKTLITGQCKFEAYMSFNDTRFQILNDKLDSCFDSIEKIGSVSRGLQTEVMNLKSTKADRSQFQFLQNEIEDLKASNLSLKTQLENLDVEQTMSSKNIKEYLTTS